MMKKNLALLFALIGWFAVVAQYVLMIENRTENILETSIRFFSFFTILTNILVALYFTLTFFFNAQPQRRFNKPGFITAITIYISIVGLVYQVALRHIWKPTGLQFVVNELLHSLIPILVIGFWYLYEHSKSVKYASIAKWMIYPMVYLVYTLIRGNQSGYYPYPFVDVNSLGLAKVFINSGILISVFFTISLCFVWLGKNYGKNS
ncbi:Pr6Pr family membrane protein [Pedobacter alpinus]|uniref:Pr6Pr family membrane protein n=1 Tax=Pedobacter alpinus TaxID=1590643 RepID=A0ABW5TNR9_9SPHI